MKRLAILWRFARPHTVLGSVISISTLYVMVVHGSGAQHFLLLAAALVIGISCNVFIVGINQIADVEIDRINKPGLPLPAGDLSMAQARRIVVASLCISLGVAAFISPWLVGIIAFSNGIGWAYSMPPLHLKRHHVTAALAIATVRGVVVNVGGFLVFNHLVNGTLELPRDMRVLTLFIVAFTVAIVWFKDLPDVEGDARHGIRTMAILYSPSTALYAGHLLVGAAYLVTIAAEFAGIRSSAVPAVKDLTLLLGHVLLLVLFILNALSIDLADKGSVRKFYQRFWLFFFAEYVLYLLAYSTPYWMGVEGGMVY
jgi:homogentisate phytyltransferase/homogentisate geranylgeranyltransferase